METELEIPLPCLVDGKPAEIVGYGDGNAGPVIDYRQDGVLKWMYAAIAPTRIKMVNENG